MAALKDYLAAFVLPIILCAVALVVWLYPSIRRPPRTPRTPRTPVGDWPAWRHDANRSASCSGDLPATLHVQWVRQYPALEPAWEDIVNQDRMPYDRVYEPVVVGSTMVFGSNRSDRVTALDTRTGEEKWRFYTGGPVRMPPVAAGGKLYVASDDGCLYCLDVETGDPAWVFRGGPSKRKVLGNGRMISTWPARGGPVVADGTVYFAAGIWPFMGVFIHALDAETGEVIWTNSEAGQRYTSQPHGGADAFGGIAPQGALAVAGDRLLVPGGRSVPACFDRAGGKQLYYHLDGSTYHDHPGSPNRKLEGGSHVSAIGDVYLNHRGLQTTLYDLASGDAYIMWQRTTYPVLTKDAIYLSGNPVKALDLRSLRKQEYHREEEDTRSGIVRNTRRYRWTMDELWTCDVDGSASLTKVGSRLYAGGKGTVSAISLAGPKPEATWSAKIPGTVSRLIAADDRLFAVTLEGRIYAFGGERVNPKMYSPEGVVSPTTGGAPPHVRAMIESAKLDKGVCLVFGLKDGNLVEAIARHSDLQVVGVDSNAATVARLRGRFDHMRLYGERIALHVDEPASFDAPPYVAVLVVSESLETAGLSKRKEFIQSVFRSLRPYGGVAWLPLSDEGQRAAFAESVAFADLDGARLRTSRIGGHVLLSREGPLPGSAPWTHMYGNIANTSKSDDELVKAPLGLLWFGGNSHRDILPRHGHGPPEQVIGGRLFIEGDNCLSARDVYTGKVLWKREFPNMGTFGIYYDESHNPDPLDTTYNQVHIAGANARGTNFVATDTEVYLVMQGKCVVLDAADGHTRREISLPREPGTGPSPTWGYVGVCDDLLLAGSQFARFSEGPAPERLDTDDQNPWDDFDVSSSRRLVAMDPKTGDVLWTRKARYAFRHNAIAVAHGRLYCIDNLPHPVRYKLILRGQEPEAAPELLCLDVRTGDLLWKVTENVFGTWLGYSESRDILLQGGRASRDMISGEPTERMIAYDGLDSSVIWDKNVEYSGPCMIHHDTVYLNAEYNEGGAINLLTGERLVRRHPLTQTPLPWQYHRTYGCNSVIASEHLLTFRSGAAGYYDLISDGGTGNLGGFKSGCTSNLIAADGVLNAPDYTRTCTCSYQNQTSLALVHDPEVEVWTAERFDFPGAVEETSEDVESPLRIRCMGLNLGAPGDRMSSNGTLWLNWPSTPEPSPSVSVRLQPVEAGEDGDSSTEGRFAGRSLCGHSSRIVGGPLRWVAASGLVDIQGLTIDLFTIAGATADDVEDSEVLVELDEAAYTVRMMFAELEDAKPGERVFDVFIGGKKVLERFDIVEAAGGPLRSVTCEFPSIRATKELNVTFRPVVGRPLLCGIELVYEDDTAGRRAARSGSGALNRGM